MKDKAVREAEAARAETEEARKKALEVKKRADDMQMKLDNIMKEEQEQKERFKWGPTNKPDWSEKENERLRNKLQHELTTPKGHTFLLFGPTGNGKSSFGNGCLAALEDREIPPAYFHVAQGDESESTGFKTKIYNLHRMIDMPGIFEGKAIKSKDIRKIVTRSLETPDQERDHKDSVECIIIILKYNSELPSELRRQIGVIWGLCGEGVLSCHVVLTHLDVCDPQFKDPKNLPKIYDSVKVQNAVEEMSKETGIPPYNISFVKNYTSKTETDLYSKLQYLRILNVVKESADLIVEARRTTAIRTEEYRKENECLPELAAAKSTGSGTQKFNVNFLDRFLTYHEFLFFLVIIFIGILVAYFSLS